MAKKQKKDKQAKAEAGQAVNPDSRLEMAFDAYQAGDQVQARKAAQAVLAGPQAADEDYARKVMGKELFAPEREVTAADAAKELIARTRPYPKAYVFAGLTAGVFLLMLFIASRY
ncbi:MAG: hypothetical protein QM723_35645 [Myxococcaceae bacterium]